MAEKPNLPPTEEASMPLMKGSMGSEWKQQKLMEANEGKLSKTKENQTFKSSLHLEVSL